MTSDLDIWHGGLPDLAVCQVRSSKWWFKIHIYGKYAKKIIAAAKWWSKC